MTVCASLQQMGVLLLLLALSLNQMFSTQNSSSLLEGSQIVTSDLLEGSQIVDGRKLLEAENVFSSCSVVTELFFPYSFSLFACFFFLSFLQVLRWNK